MPGADGLQVLATANSDNLNTRILFLSAAVSSRMIITAMAEGAYAILFKDSNPDEIVNAFGTQLTEKSASHLKFSSEYAKKNLKLPRFDSQAIDQT